MKNDRFGVYSRGGNQIRPIRLLAAIGLAASTLVVGLGSGVAYAAPGIMIEKSTNGDDADVAPGPSVGIGSEVNWEYLVTNIGDTDLIDIVVIDDQGESVVCDTDVLAPGITATCAASGIVELGQYTNVGTVTAQPVDAQGTPIGAPVQDSDSSNYNGIVGTGPTTCYAVSDGPPDNELGTDALIRAIVSDVGALDIENLGLITTTDGAEVKSIEALAIERDTPEMYFVDDATNALLKALVYTDGTVITKLVATLSEDVDVDGLTFQGPVLWGVTRLDSAPDNLITIDTATGVVTTIGPIDDFNPRPPNVIGDVDDIAWDVTTNTLFGVMGSAATNYLIEIDPATGDGTFVTGRPAVDDIEGLGVSDAPGTDGTLFGVTGTSGEFYLINKDTGASALIGELGAATGREDFESVDCHELLLLEKASIGDTVWLDFDEDGEQGSTEFGLAGVVVDLLDDTGAATATATTDATGKYLFPDLPVGDYTVRVDPATLPDGATQTYDADGLGTPHLSEKSLASGEDDRLQDFGYTLPAAALGDTVWSDTDADGTQDDGEAGVPGIPVTLLADVDGDGVPETTIGSTTTDDDGTYVFTGLNPSFIYFVQFDSPDLTLQNLGDDATDSDGDPDTGLTGPIDLDPGETDNTIDAGIIRASIGDTVWFDDDGDGVIDPDEDGIADVTIELRDADGTVVDTATTDADGMYIFTDLAPGAYTVTVVASTLPDAVTQTFDGDGLATLNESSTSILAGGEDLDQDFGYQPLGSIGDTVWLDDNGDGVIDPDEDGIAGVTVTLSDRDGNVIGTATTDADGMYLFEDLPPGDYTVTVDPSTLPADLAATFDNDGTGSANESSTTLGAGDDDLDQDFGYQPEGSVGDTVWLDADGDGVLDPGEAGIAAVRVTLFDGDGVVIATAATDANGKYLYPKLPSGSYCVQVDETTLPTGVLQTFSPSAVTIPGCALFTLDAGEDNLDQDFGYRAPTPDVVLPRTGGDTNGLLVPALMMLLLGAAVLLVSRSRFSRIS